MRKTDVEIIPTLFNYIDFLVVTDKEGYIEYYKVFRSLGSRIVKDPVGLHILELHQHLDEETSTIMRVLKNKEPIINEKQYLNIFKERTVTVVSTTLPIKEGNEVIGAVDINRYIYKSIRDIENSKYEDITKKKNHVFTIDDILTKNDAMIKVKNRTLKAAQTNSPVMIYGETGTGKELIAQSIHNHSLRKDNPFIVQNCSAIPLTLGESTFFGTTRGSFTGAENKMGLFEMADGGTLVLDEINSMDINLQSKLLRTVENESFRRVGGKDLINVDVKLISILNEDIHSVLENNKMRRDLFYRLGVVLIHIPPLRERKEDIPLLVDSFINEYNFKMGKNIKGVSKDVMDLFMEYNWPGNVRELKHIIESAFNFAEGEIIDKEELPHHISTQKPTSNTININGKFSLTDAIEEHEIKYIKLALESSSTLNEAASLLKISRQTLKYKIDSLGIEIE
ncbi:sigma 54-interacting transcriptional regulator [Anaerosalibacter bizertensis]|uniref:Sigma 54-interacting transcriptional regulator n=1 Tax=Anaerosalibacter bizertensis TaxID=932217 RepID=A0A9Q4ADG1_9FIRM|nr:sigma 54-interacting transcriptional regulator [Anaerosalibacter bizertensis]MBV1818227.1 sigma 54-interacting transcriptional regulator [Bacteroidales bacterium MSK.15.36]MCG4565460.1 sigma 54-interacting transcriptional regulator [Anaerosalibacter bizertensis]MCG4582287.1 sigma 54-interacting transcriptional regulator [Anaerosalibacter bizertensis]